MGGLLGIDACLRGHCVDSMILLACPLRIRISWRYLRNSVCAVLGWWDQNPFVHATRLGNSVQARHPWEYLSCARPYAQLLRKSRDVRRRVGALTIPVAALHGSRDEIVHRRSLDCFKGRANASRCILSGCGHEYYTEEARGIILALVEEALGVDAAQANQKSIPLEWNAFLICGRIQGIRPDSCEHLSACRSRCVPGPRDRRRSAR